MHKAVSVFLLLCLAACDSSNREPHNQSLQETNADILSPCYQYSLNKDTVLLQLTVMGDSVTGTLVNSLYEKDANTGTVKGIVTQETLFLDYTFMSEGVLSIREVTFLRTEDGLIEGYGQMKEKDGKMKFVSRKSIVFNGNMLLQPVPCQ